MAFKGQYCQDGALTLVPLPGYEQVAQRVAQLIEERGRRAGERVTPVDVAKPRFALRPSGETYVELPNTHIVGHDCVIIGSGPGTDEMIMKLMWTVGHVAGRHARRISIVTGYFPQSRSDADEGDSILTLPPMIVAMATAQAGDTGIFRWVCVDPHCKQLPQSGKAGKITPVYLTRRLLSFALRQSREQDANLTIILAFPDDTAKKRYDPAMKDIAKEPGERFPMIVASKVRDDAQTTEIVTMVGALDKVPGSRVLMFDDEIATGGSVIDMARRLKGTHGAHSVWACASHPILCASAKQNFTGDADARAVDHIVVADTIRIDGRPSGIEELRDSGLMTVYSWHEDLAWVIYRNHWGLSVRDLR